MKVNDLPLLDEGDYGWCMLWDDEDPEHHRLRLVHYDDDDCWCSEGLDEKDEEHECAEGDPCFLDTGAIVHTTPTCNGICETVPYEHLRRFDARIEATRGSDKEGFIYAVSIVPEIDMRRIKVGYSRENVDARIRKYRTANPHAVLVGLWNGNASDEGLAHDILTGRIGRSEVFDCVDLKASLEAITRILKAPPR